MRILLINPPHPSIGSRLPGEHLPPLGLLSIGGPLIDRGHEVRLLDAEFGPMGFADIVAETLEYRVEKCGSMSYFIFFFTDKHRHTGMRVGEFWP